MEPSCRNRWQGSQIRPPRNRLKWAELLPWVATGCRKEPMVRRVGGSSPPEGFAKVAAYRLLPIPIRTMDRTLDVHQSSTKRRVIVSMVADAQGASPPTSTPPATSPPLLDLVREGLSPSRRIGSLRPPMREPEVGRCRYFFGVARKTAVRRPSGARGSANSAMNATWPESLRPSSQKLTLLMVPPSSLSPVPITRSFLGSGPT